MTTRHTVNLRMFQGDDLRVICTVRDQTGQLVDISNAQSIRWQAAPRVNDAPVIEKSLGNGLSISSPTGFTFDITSAESAPLSGQYYHEAEVVTDQGLTYTALFGTLIIDRALID